MMYDPIRATLAIEGDNLEKLAAVVEAGGGLEELGQEWHEAGVIIGDELLATVRGIVEILQRPARSIMIERFSQGFVVPLFVAWDGKGRATLTDGTPDGQLVIEATSFDLLPSLLMQALHLHSGLVPVSGREAVTTTAGVLEAIINPDSELAREARTDDELAALRPIVAEVDFAWRVSGSWPGQPTDTSITAISAGSEGLWTVVHDAQDRTQEPSADTVVHLVPATVTELTAKLGDVVTGRGVRSFPQAC